MVLGAFAAIAGLLGKCVNLSVVSFGCDSSTAIKNIDKLRDELKDDVFLNNSSNLTVVDIKSEDLKLNLQVKHLNKLTIQQKIGGTNKIISKIDSALSSTLVKRVNDSIKEAFENLSDEEKGLLTKSSGSSTITELQTDMTTTVSKSLSVDNLLKVKVFQQSGQKMEVIISAEYIDELSFNQDYLVNLYLETVLEQTIKNVANSQRIQNIRKYSKNKNKSRESSGVQIALIVISVGAVIALIVYAYYKSKSGAKATEIAEAVVKPKAKEEAKK
jgi:hypothetical protein